MYKMSIEVEGNGITSSGKYRVSTVSEPSPPISGTFKLFYDSKALEVYVNNAWTSDIPYNVAGWQLQQGLERMFQYSYFHFDSVHWNREYDGRKIVLYFKDIKGNLPLLVADAGNLRGGLTG